MIINRKGEESQLRTFEGAIDELVDTIAAAGWTRWSFRRLSLDNGNLYAWFKYHCRDDEGNVDAQRILQALPERERTMYSNYSGQRDHEIDD